MAALLEGFKSLGIGRLIALAAVAAAMMLILAFLALRGGTNDHMALLYADMDVREAAQVVDQLDKAHIAHEVGPDGTRVSVPASDVPRARLLLAKEGLPSGGSIGYEIFDRSDNLTASQFQQAISQTRAMEGELVRSIRMISGVRAARVHLVLPKREPFSRDRQEAQASVVLTMSGAARMDREGIQSVLNLVSSAVPGLRPQNIGIIDSRGNLLARAGDLQNDQAGGAAAELRISTEQRLSRSVEDMLERSLGPGRVRVETAVEMNYDQVRETQEKFDPDSKVERSTQNNNTTNKTTEAPAGNVSVANNLPNADAGTNPAGSQEQRSEETTNYEIGKTTRTTVRDQPLINRISLAVMVDQVPVKGADGNTTWQDRTPDELNRIAALARSAVGFDEKRGDKVEVVSLRFMEAETPPEAPKPSILGLAIDKADLMKFGQTGLLALVALLALLFVLRPMVMRLTANTALLTDGSSAAVAAAGLALAAPGQRAVTMAGGGSGGTLAIAGPGSAEADESMVSLGSVEGAIKASSLRQIAELVDKHPEESLAVMRGWMVKEAT
jgi:flagellar M-ring protein FliF